MLGPTLSPLLQRRVKTFRPSKQDAWGAGREQGDLADAREPRVGPALRPRKADGESRFVSNTHERPSKGGITRGNKANTYNKTKGRRQSSWLVRKPFSRMLSLGMLSLPSRKGHCHLSTGTVRALSL